MSSGELPADPSEFRCREYWRGYRCGRPMLHDGPCSYAPVAEGTPKAEPPAFNEDMTQHWEAAQRPAEPAPDDETAWIETKQPGYRTEHLQPGPAEPVPTLERWGRADNLCLALLQPREDGYWTPWHLAVAALAKAGPAVSLLSETREQPSVHDTERSASAVQRPADEDARNAGDFSRWWQTEMAGKGLSRIACAYQAWQAGYVYACNALAADLK